jgi:hypothetical protein
MARQQPAEPEQETEKRRLIEMHLVAQGGNGLGGRRLAKENLRNVARQHFGREEDHESDNQQRQGHHAQAKEHLSGR